MGYTYNVGGYQLAIVYFKIKSTYHVLIQHVETLFSYVHVKIHKSQCCVNIRELKKHFPECIKIYSYEIKGKYQEIILFRFEKKKNIYV